jgi:hypothetical protein
MIRIRFFMQLLLLVERRLQTLLIKTGNSMTAHKTGMIAGCVVDRNVIANACYSFPWTLD